MTNKIYITILLFLSCFGFVLNAQDTIPPVDTSHLRIVSKYRNAIVNKNKKALDELKQMYEEWESHGLTEEEMKSLTVNLLVLFVIKKLPLPLVKFYRKNSNAPPQQLKTITKFSKKTMVKNASLLDLWGIGLVQFQYPYQIDTSGGDFFEELAFYEIENGQEIADIGGGNGTLALLVAMLYEDVSVYMNEIVYEKLEYFKGKIAEVRRIYRPDLKGLTPVMGSARNVRLKNKKMDKIIIRKTIHHFKFTKAMLKSIRKSLKPDGDLYIGELPKEKDPEGKKCKLLWEQDKLLKIMEENGFKLIKKTRIGDKGFMLYHYKIAS